MTFIKTLRLNKFRVFDKVEFELSKLNIISGYNGTGKSSILHSIHAFKEHKQEAILNHDVELETNEGIKLLNGNLSPFKWDYIDSITYLKPVKLPEIQLNLEINNTWIKHEETESINAMTQVKSWVYGLIPNVNSKYNNSGKWLTNIVANLLMSEPGDILLLENPEVYLHPEVKSKVGELLSLAVKNNIQIVIETNDDHIFNGIRVAVHGGLIKPEDVKFHHLGLYENYSPRINKEGRLDEWPRGFFGEWEENLFKLLEPAEE